MPASFHRDADKALAEGRFAVAIDILERGLSADAEDFDGWMKLAALRRRFASPRTALDAVHASLSARPNHFVALLLKGALHEQLDEPALAAEVYRAALFHAAHEPALPPPLTQQLDRARQFLARYRATIESRLTVTEHLDGPASARAARFVDNVLERRPAYHQEPTHYRYPGLPDVEYFDFAYPRLLARLRAAFPAIRAEFQALAAQHADRQQPYVAFADGQPVGQWAALNHSPDWNALHLIRYGEVDPVNAALCPETVAAFAGPEQADIPSLAPNLMFSLLKPGVHIPPHHGVANFRSVLHLPLIVPPGCRFRVGADERRWIEGEPWIFDDTIEHEGWNDSDALRVVLIGDVWRPELDETDRMIVRDVIAAQDGANVVGAL